MLYVFPQTDLASDIKKSLKNGSFNEIELEKLNTIIRETMANKDKELLKTTLLYQLSILVIYLMCSIVILREHYTAVDYLKWGVVVIALAYPLIRIIARYFNSQQLARQFNKALKKGYPQMIVEKYRI